MAMTRLNNQQAEDDTLIEFEKEGDSLEGYYVGSKSFVSKKGNDVTKHMFRSDDGDLISCFGSYVINEDLKKVEKGVRVRITYGGQTKSKKGRTVNVFTIEADNDDRETA